MSAFGRSGSYRLDKAAHEAQLTRERDARGENCIVDDPKNYDPVVEDRRLDRELRLTLIALALCLAGLVYLLIPLFQVP